MLYSKQLLAVSALFAFAAAAPTVYLAPPPAGSTADVTGTVTDLGAGSYKAVLLVSPNQNDWYDKTHGPGQTVVNGKFTFTGWAWDPQGDAQVPYFGVWVVPSTHDMSNFYCEGGPVPASLVQASVATSITNRNNPQNPPGSSVAPGASTAPGASSAASRGPVASGAMETGVGALVAGALIGATLVQGLL